MRRPVLVTLAVLTLAACSAEPPVTTAEDASAIEVTAAPAAAGLPAPAQRAPSAAPAPASPSAASAAPAAPSSDTAGSHTDPGKIDVVVNKRRPLSPIDYAPADLRVPEVSTATANALLRPDTAAAVEEMFRTAAADGVALTLVSGYRSYADQEATYAHWVSVYGNPTAADTVSARPGHSEHQTGLAFDIGQADGACTLTACFSDTAAARWAAEHAADFGFILRYPLGASETTGFFAESWHFRFVGKDVAIAMRSAGTQTLEEHFGMPAAPSY
jgi:D-alanyl-D-alanine carboxypeptidase